MLFDTDGSALDAVRLAHYKANEMQKPYAIVTAPSGGLIAVPLDQCKVEAIEIVNPTGPENEKEVK